MVSLDTTDGQWTKVDILELIAPFDPLICSLFLISSVPFWSDQLVCSDIIHHLVVHLVAKDAKYNEKDEAVEHAKAIECLHMAHETT